MAEHKVAKIFAVNDHKHWSSSELRITEVKSPLFQNDVATPYANSFCLSDIWYFMIVI